MLGRYIWGRAGAILKTKVKEAQMKYPAILGLVLMLVVGWTSTTNAAARWYVCTVNATGIADTQAVLIRLSDTASSPAFTHKWFLADSKVANEMLATSLSTITAGLKLWIKVDLESGSVPVISRMYARDF